MSNQTYVIRGYHFGYNDECFYVCGSCINNIYHNKEQAESEYKALEIKYARNAELTEIESIFNADSDLIKKINDYIFQKTGVPILGEAEFLDRGAQLPSTLSDDEVFEFVNLAQMQAYNLVTFENNPIFYGFWDTQAGEYLKDYDEYYTSLIYEASREAAIERIEFLIQYKAWDTMEIAGTIEDLSSNPILLKQLISTNKCFNYDFSQSKLLLKKARAKDLVALNELLKAPFLEWRELDPQSILKLEKEFDCNNYEKY